MKLKRIFAFVLTVCLTSVLAGCSCSAESELEFNNAFNNNKAPESGYTETSVYEVNYYENYNSDSEFEKDASITDSFLKIEIVGTYTTELTVQSFFEEKSPLLNRKFSSDIKKEVENSSAGILIYKFQTSLELTASYTINGEKEDDKTDTIKTVCYFVPAKSSFAPVYSETICKYSSVLVSEITPYFITYDIKCYTEYNNDNYVMHSEYANGNNETENEKITATDNYNYTKCSAIDNTQLLFAIRNLGLNNNSSYQIPTVSYQYGNPETLTVKHNGGQEIEFKNNLTVNGEPFSGENVVSEKLEFRLADAYRSGKKQLCFIQKEETANLESKALLLSYIEPMVESGSYKTLGAMVYKLKSVNYSTN